MKKEDIFKGVFPVLPTTFLENQELDLDSQKRAIDCVIDQGADGLCILANYSEQFLLSDEERNTLLKVCLKHVGQRIPVIVTCSHYSSHVVIERAKMAKSMGADMIMLMPPYHGSELIGDETAVFEQLSIVSDQVDIPLMLQDATLSGVHLSSTFLGKLLDTIPNTSYLKIEVPDTAEKIASLVSHNGKYFRGAFDGENAITLLPNLKAGAIGTMPSALLSELLKPILANFFSGNTVKAEEMFNHVLPLINYELYQCGIQAAKIVMKEGKVINSDIVRHPLTPTRPEARREILRLAKHYDLLALKWGK